MAHEIFGLYSYLSAVDFLEVDPNDTHAWYSLGGLLCLLKKHDDAEKANRKARELGHV